MRYCNTGIAKTEKPETRFISKNGEKFMCQPQSDYLLELKIELMKLGVESLRSKEILVPFSSITIRLLLDKNHIFEEKLSEFDLETVLDEVAGFGTFHRKIGEVKNLVADRIASQCKDSNCFLIHRKMIEYSCQYQSEKVLNYIKKNLIRMVKQKTVDIFFYRLEAEDLDELLSDESTNLKNRQNVLEVISAWISINQEEREKFREMFTLPAEEENDGFEKMDFA